MDAVIGRELPLSLRARWAIAVAACCVAVGATVASRRVALLTGQQALAWVFFVIVTLASCVLIARATRWDRRSLGLTLFPVSGIRYWVRVGILGGLSILAVVLTTVAIARAGGPDPFGLRAAHVHPPTFVATVEMLVLSPVFEELLYRLVLSTALAGVAKPWIAVGGGAVVFTWAHWTGGALGPDNLLAGVFFGWVYLRSGTIWIPIVFHSIGNLGALLLSAAGAG